MTLLNNMIDTGLFSAGEIENRISLIEKEKIAINNKNAFTGGKSPFPQMLEELETKLQAYETAIEYAFI